MTYPVIFKRPLHTTAIFGALGLVCPIRPSYCIGRSFLALSAVARCDTKTVSSPRAPSTTTLNPELSKKFNTTRPDVMTDLAISDLLPSGIDLKDSTQWKCTIYQFESCPFCRKVRSCLDYLRIPYEVVETHPLSKKELKPITDYKKVPVLVVDGVGENAPRYILKDSKRIIHALMSHEGKSVPETEIQRKETELAWVKWSDDVLVQLIVMNIYRTIQESAETFAYLLTHPQYSFFEKYSARISGTLVMWLVSKRRKSKYQITDERRELYSALNEFILAKGSECFHGGDAPNEADLNVYGILRSIEGFTCEEDVIKNTEIRKWMDDMKRVSFSDDHKISRGPKR